MKKILTISILALSVSQYSNAQFSIRINDLDSNAVDILYKANDSFAGTRSSQFFEFAIQMPLPMGDSVNATFVKGAPLASIAAFDAYPSATEYGYRTWAWASSGVPNYTLTYNFVSGQEVVLGTVYFTPKSPSTQVYPALVAAIDYNDQPVMGGATGVAIWTYQQDPEGLDVSWDRTPSVLFFQSANSAIRQGSAPPTTTTDGGVINAKVGLTQPLPINLLTFDAKKENRDAKIDWSAVEKDEENASYELYRSIDGRTFEQIAIVKAKNEAQALYTYYDMDIAQYGVSQIYYQLYVKENSGNVTKSEIKTIQLGNSNNANAPVLYPNPIKDNRTTISLSSSINDVASITICDLTGRILNSSTQPIQKGTNEIILDFSGFATGSYFVNLKYNNYNNSFKVIKN